MTSDDHDERVRRVLAVVLAVFLTFKKRCRARTLAGWGLALDVLKDIETTEGEDIDDGGGPRIKHSLQVYPRSDFS